MVSLAPTPEAGANSKAPKYSVSNCPSPQSNRFLGGERLTHVAVFAQEESINEGLVIYTDSGTEFLSKHRQG